MRPETQSPRATVGRRREPSGRGPSGDHPDTLGHWARGRKEEEEVGAFRPPGPSASPQSDSPSNSTVRTRALARKKERRARLPRPRGPLRRNARKGRGRPSWAPSSPPNGGCGRAPPSVHPPAGGRRTEGTEWGGSLLAAAAHSWSGPRGAYTPVGMQRGEGPSRPLRGEEGPFPRPPWSPMCACTD